MSTYLLAIDQGTTSSRAIIFSQKGFLISQYQLEFKQYFPNHGWVEHDPEEIWQTTLTCCRIAIERADLTATDILAVGISNQRETTIIWDKKSGVPIYPAIVWQDRRTADFCQNLINRGVAPDVKQKTGLLIDPYFSASKISWLLDNLPKARNRAEKGELAFGTIDTFLLWRLTNGRSHATDATNASRTLLYNIHKQCWDSELLSVFNVPAKILPKVLDNCSDFGYIDKSHLGVEIPITAMIGDQQAALVGQGCFKPGMIKSTYGTGCFVMLNTGDKVVVSKNQLLSTVAYRIKNKPIYSLEGSIFIAGAAVQWLRDTLKLIPNANETEYLAEAIRDNGGVYLVPAFAGLGAPYWDPLARGAIFGLTRDTGINHIVRAALEAVCYQTRDLLEAFAKDYKFAIKQLRVDGGMVKNNWLMQFLTDILHISVERAAILETSALGAAYLAGLQMGIYSSLEEISSLWQMEKSFTPQMNMETRENLYQGWNRAVQSLIHSEK